MSRLSYDALVIGSGQAGPFLAAKLVAAGQKVALVERAHFGGTCLNDGCTPTKTLVASARVAHLARRAADFGVLTGPVQVDMRAVKARTDRVVSQAVEGLTRWLEGMAGLRLVRGHARFVGPHAVAVGEEVLEAPRIFVNTGGRPLVPDWPGLAGVPHLTNTSLLALDVLPSHLVVVGASYIGLEFAQAYRRLGAEVTVLEAGERAIAREDPEVSREVQAILEREGVRFLFGTQSPAVARRGDAVVVGVTAQGERHEVEGSHLLFAVGRRPNTDDLGLDAAGIATDARGFITVDDRLRTGVEGVWALGDVNGRGAFTHTSYNDFEIALDDVLGNGGRRVSDRIPAYALFTDPPLGRVGLSEAEVRQRGRPALVGTMPMTRVSRAKERGETQGFMKVLVDAQTDRLLGAALLCIEGDEIVHALIDAMAGGVPCSQLARTVHIHPTVSELVPTLLQELKPLAP